MIIALKLRSDLATLFWHVLGDGNKQFPLGSQHELCVVPEHAHQKASVKRQASGEHHHVGLRRLTKGNSTRANYRHQGRKI
jgi:hypothetical protein